MASGSSLFSTANCNARYLRQSTPHRRLYRQGFGRERHPIGVQSRRLGLSITVGVRRCRHRPRFHRQRIFHQGASRSFWYFSVINAGNWLSNSTISSGSLIPSIWVWIAEMDASMSCTSSLMARSVFDKTASECCSSSRASLLWSSDNEAL